MKRSLCKIASDHPLIRVGLRTVLTAEPDLLLVGEANDDHEAQHLCQKLRPDVLVLAVNVPDSKEKVGALLHQLCPETKVLVLAASWNGNCTRELVKAGVMGYVLEEEASDATALAIRTIAQGATWFSQRVMKELVQEERSKSAPDEPASLTGRELKVLRLVADGKTNREIAHVLGLSVKTVEKGLEELFANLEVRSRAQAAVWAVRQGLI